MAGESWEELVAGVCQGRARSLARLITRVENREPGWSEAMKALYPHTGRARVLGITGSPGAGKSSLVDGIAARLIEQGLRVAIIAVDPSSPFSGGALLGDRLRMRAVALVEGVFIRSMATRGALGGLCQGVRDVARVLDAAGYDRILIETVGVGQDEIDVVRAAEAVGVVCMPGQGDGVEALKAGIMEIADVFIVNKADLEGAEQLASDIRSMLALGSAGDAEPPPLVETNAISGQGIERLVEVVGERLEALAGSRARSDARAREEILTLIERELARRVRAGLAADGRFEAAVERVREGEFDPYSAAESLLPPLAPAE